MAKAESVGSSMEGFNIEFMRSLVKQYSELGQWTSALFWADAAAGVSSAEGAASGDDVWLLASTMLARGEYHRAAYAVTSRDLHRRHLLCLGVAMRAHIAAKEPEAALARHDECDPALLEPRLTDQKHNRALGGVLVCLARALASLERREAAAAALRAALMADAACVEALDLLLEHHSLDHAEEVSLVESLPLSRQLGAAEAALAAAAYRERLRRYEPAPKPKPAREPVPDNTFPSTPMTPTTPTTPAPVPAALGRTAEAGVVRARRLAAGCEWAAALKELDGIDPWCCPEVRVSCLVELRRAAALFALAHALVDAYPHAWQAWYAVGCYYYLIGKTEFARRYLSKAKSVSAGAGCVWLAFGHCFVPDSEHDQAMAAYFKASQLMAGCHLPPLYVAVECSLLNNQAMSERFFLRAATHCRHAQCGAGAGDDSLSGPEGVDGPGDPGAGWARVAHAVRDPHVAHEAGAAAFRAGHYAHAATLWRTALALAADGEEEVSSRWAGTLDALGHAVRRLGGREAAGEALQWHRRALALRPARAATLAAVGLCLALLGREPEAADALHAALARDPDDVVALALLDIIVDRLDAALSEEDIPMFKFPAVCLALPAVSPAAADADGTIMSDMSMSFD